MVSDSTVREGKRRMKVMWRMEEKLRPESKCSRREPGHREAREAPGRVSFQAPVLCPGFQEQVLHDLAWVTTENTADHGA